MNAGGFTSRVGRASQVVKERYEREPVASCKLLLYLVCQADLVRNKETCPPFVRRRKRVGHPDSVDHVLVGHLKRCATRRSIAVNSATHFPIASLIRNLGPALSCAAGIWWARIFCGSQVTGPNYSGLMLYTLYTREASPIGPSAAI